jgi:hypothetical protein
MNVVGVVVLASPPRDPIRSKCHNGQRLRASHTYRATTTPPPWSSMARWSGRWDQQHDGVVLMGESMCGQDFAYTREVEEYRQRSSQTRERKYYKKRRRRRLKQFSILGQNLEQPAGLFLLYAYGVSWSMHNIFTKRICAAAMQRALHEKNLLGRSAKLSWDRSYRSTR